MLSKPHGAQEPLTVSDLTSTSAALRGEILDSSSDREPFMSRACIVPWRGWSWSWSWSTLLDGCWGPGPFWGLIRGASRKECLVAPFLPRELLWSGFCPITGPSGHHSAHPTSLRVWPLWALLVHADRSQASPETPPSNAQTSVER